MIYYTSGTDAKAKRAMTALVSQGHSITYDWTTQHESDPARAPYVSSRMANAAMHGILIADVFIIEDAGAASLIELGFALAYAPRIYIVGVLIQPYAFYQYAKVRHAHTLAEVLLDLDLDAQGVA